MNYLGIDIGGTKCAVVLGDEKGNILKKEVYATSTVHDTLNWIVDTAEKLKGESRAIGISCGGPLDSKKGIILSPPNLPGWDEIEIVKILEDRLNIPAFLCNDANACAIAEMKFGAGRGCRNMVFLTFGTGLGAGLILNGELYAGACDMAGEVGHIRLSESGPVGYGKSGSFEGFCSGGGIKQLGAAYALEKLQMGKKVSFCEDISKLDLISAKLIGQKADEGEQDAIEVFEICGEKLGHGLSILIDILNPEKIVIGSIYQRCEHLLTRSMDKVLKKECLAASYDACKVVAAELKENIGDIAALSVAAMFGKE